MSRLTWLNWCSRSASAAGLVLLLSCGGGGGSSPSEPGTPAPKMVTVQIVDVAFNPKDVQINPGDTVQWVLASTTYTHTVTSEDGSFDSGMAFKSGGATFMHTFTKQNVTVQYHCNTHWHTNGMQGSVEVGSAAPPPPPGY
jgi:plastocyanin